MVNLGSDMSSNDRDIGSYRFAWVCKIEPTRDDKGVVVAFLPPSRYDNVRGVPLHKYGAGPFCEFRVPSGLKLAGRLRDLCWVRIEIPRSLRREGAFMALWHFAIR
jgi:hypothetical protein